MMKMEYIIKKRGREPFYKFYLSLGYDHRTAAALALFTYGDHRYTTFSMNDLYEALSGGREYLPKEVLEERMRRERMAKGGAGNAANGPFFGAAQACSSAPAMQMRTAAPAPAGAAPQADCCVEEAACDYMSVNETISAGPLAFELSGAPHLSGTGFATDEYEPIEEKDARTTAAEPTSTFRMTTNTASAGIVLNQLRNGRRIDKSMVRIEEMLNYFRYDSVIPKEEMFNISCEMMDAGETGTGEARKYLYINVQGREEVKDRQHIILLVL